MKLQNIEKNAECSLGVIPWNLVIVPHSDPLFFFEWRIYFNTHEFPLLNKICGCTADKFLVCFYCTNSIRSKVNFGYPNRHCSLLIYVTKTDHMRPKSTIIDKHFMNGKIRFGQSSRRLDHRTSISLLVDPEWKTELRLVSPLSAIIRLFKRVENILKSHLWFAPYMMVLKFTSNRPLLQLPLGYGEYEVLWLSEIVKLYLQLLQESSNPVILEAASGAIQNLAACFWQVSIYIASPPCLYILYMEGALEL